MLMARRCSAVSGSASAALIAALSLATIGAGVFGGAASAFQVSERKFLTPASSMVGTSATEAIRAGAVTASILILPARYCSRTERSEERRVGKEWRRRWWPDEAEDGIRDWSVTGVQTCALPIFELGHDRSRRLWRRGERVPSIGAEIFDAGFLHGWHLRYRGNTRRRRHREHFDLAGAVLLAHG